MKKEALLYEQLSDKRVQCHLCHHFCRIKDGQAGICRVRQNTDGILYTLVYGSVIAAHVDPIEKKPLYHVLPGSLSYSIATAGCNFQCDFCQNWEISQVPQDKIDAMRVQTLYPEEVVKQAQGAGCRSIAYTYTEPTIFFEYALDTARLAHGAGLKNIFVTNGYMTREALNIICPYLDAANVDLKSFRDAFYRGHCGARLEPVLDSIRYMRELGIWVEITTLLLPGENDSEEELSSIAKFIFELDPGIPWHITRFHPDFRLQTGDVTALSSLHRAQQIGRENGLRYIYVGNVREEATTCCPQCGSTVLRRNSFALGEDLLEDGHCSSCGCQIAGIW